MIQCMLPQIQSLVGCATLHIFIYNVFQNFSVRILPHNYQGQLFLPARNDKVPKIGVLHKRMHNASPFLSLSGSSS